MARIYRGLAEICWGLGVLSMLGGLVFRFVHILEVWTTLTSRGGLILGGVLFLCSLATREMERAAPAKT